jgi:hypothetical protein
MHSREILVVLLAGRLWRLERATSPIPAQLAWIVDRRT